MISVAAAAVAVALGLAGEPKIPKADEACFSRVVATAPAGATEATLLVDWRRAAQKPVAGGRRVTFGIRGRSGRHDVRISFDRGRRLVARRAWLLPSSAGQAIPERRRDTLLAGKLARLGRAYRGYAGLWVHDLHTGRTAGWNSDASFPAASLVKLAVLIAALDRFGPRPERSAAWGDIRALATWSSNRASNSLLIRLGGSEAGGTRIVQNVLDRVGATSSTFTGFYEMESSPAADLPRPPPLLTYRRTTAHDAGRMLYMLQAAALGQPEAARRTRLSRHEARVGLGLLLSSVRGGGNAGILRPAGPAAQKHGWTTTVRHTAAIVYRSHGPVIVVVLTFRPDAVDPEASRALGGRVLALLR